jgi:deoxyribose-phosphate aldolase
MQAADIVRCIDLTSLSGQESDADIVKLCQDAVTPLGAVAAICIYPQYLSLAKRHVPSGVKLATVVNFPLGLGGRDVILFEVKSALALGADEIDIVIPYEEVLRGDLHHSGELIAAVKAVVGDRLVKVILETGVLADPDLIFRVSEVLLVQGADFLKTSTGKVAVGATEDAVDAMLKALLQHAQKTGVIKGLKISGGVRAIAQAESYMAMASSYFGKDYLRPKTFRIGASSLLQALLV